MERGRPARRHALTPSHQSPRAAAWALGLTALLAVPAAANSPLVPIIALVGFPLMAAVKTLGAALALIVVVEAWVLARRAGLRPLPAFGLALQANISSTLLGAGLWFTYSSSFGILPGGLIGALMLAALLGRALQQATGASQPAAKARCFVFSFLASLAAVPVSYGVAPGYSYPHAGPDPGVIPAALLLLAGGFAVSVISEAASLARFVSGGPRRLFSTVLAMNLASYALLVPVAMPAVWPLITQSGSFRREQTRAGICRANLRDLAAAKRKWLKTREQGEPEVPALSDLAPYLRHSLQCPSGGRYLLGRPGREPICSVPGHRL